MNSRSFRISYIVLINVFLFSSPLYAESLENQCNALIQRLENISCKSSFLNIAEFMEDNEYLVESYRLNNDGDQQNLSFLYEALSASARTVQDCLVKHGGPPINHKLVDAQVSMTKVVNGLMYWKDDQKYLIPPKDSMLKGYRDTITSLYTFANDETVLQ